MSAPRKFREFTDMAELRRLAHEHGEVRLAAVVTLAAKR